MKPLFGVSGGGALAAILGIVSGYPIGASTVTNLYESGSISKSDALRLLTFCNNSGPLFILGAVGIGMLHSRDAGIFLYIIHLVSALLTGILFRGYNSNDNHERFLPPADIQTGKNIASAVGISITNSIETILKVCGFVIFFSVFCTSLPSSNFTPFIYSFLEITGGVKALLCSTHISSSLFLPVTSFFIALSGLSVLLQTTALTSPANLSVKPYIYGKIVQALIAFFITFIVQSFFPVTYTVSLDFTYPISPSVFLSPRAQFIAFFFSFIVSTLVIAILYFIVWLLKYFEDRK